MSKLNIGILSENFNNDGESIATLLERYFPEQANYLQFCQDYRGTAIQTDECLLDLEIAFLTFEPDFVIIIKDLDKDKNQTKCDTFFELCKAATNDQAQFLLFKYMIEALAMADLDAVCKHYKVSLKKIKINKKARNAKKELHAVFGYEEHHICVLAKKFDTKILTDNYSVWRDFINDFDEKLRHFIMR
ncbi:MAG: hypothetical protein RLZZ292_1830 [Bacteroidota bacterium]|jgi:hypothetical protein